MIKPFYKKFFKVFSISLFISLVIIQFIPSSFSRTNPPITGEPAWDAPATRATFMKACGDCHSNETVYPWYSQIAPVSLLIEDDIRDGRRHFNISEWDKSAHGGDDAAEEVQKGSMPIGLYLLMHSEANLNAADKTKFAEGLQRTFRASSENDEEAGNTEHDEREQKEERK